MYLSRIRLKRGAHKRADFWKNLSVFDAGHRLMWRVFGDGTERSRDFLFRQDGHGPAVSFIALSQREPRASMELWDVETRRFEPKLRSGERLCFSLRANPTRRAAAGAGRGKRHDVVFHAKQLALAHGEQAKPESERVQHEVSAWLQGRASRGGFTVHDLVVEGYAQHRVEHGRGRKPILFSTVDIDGVLEVVDPERFLATLTSGIGSAKAFGCGLMLIRRA